MSRTKAGGNSQPDSAIRLGAAEPRRKASPGRQAVGERPKRVFDANGKILGRLATEVAHILRGKDQPTWVPYRDDGPVIVVTNTDQIRVTGRKLQTKVYHRHIMRKPGAGHSQTLAERLQRDSRAVVRDAIWNMLPKNRLRHRMITRLKLYKGAAAG